MKRSATRVLYPCARRAPHFAALHAGYGTLLVLEFSPGLLSRPCARMETKVEGLILGIYATLCLLLVASMMAFGPTILEWVEGTPSEPR